LRAHSLICKHLAEKSAAWEIEQQRIKDEANRKRSEAVRQCERKPDGTLASAATSSGTTGSSRSKNLTAPPIATPKPAAPASSGAVERIDQLARKRSDLADTMFVDRLLMHQG
jgi:hypothetical protein